MNPTHASKATQFKVGLFTLLGLLLIGIISIYVNDRPFWWRPCQLVKIEVEDATGLKTKSPVRSLGLEIGFLESVDLHETHVTLGICVTAPVEILPNTRAFIRGEGFLGDKFVELKPVRFIGDGKKKASDSTSEIKEGRHPAIQTVPVSGGDQAFGWLIASAYAEEKVIPASASTPSVAASTSEPQTVMRTKNGDRQIPVGQSNQDVQALMGKVDTLVGELTGLTQNLRQSINPEELRQTLRQVNKTLEIASKTLSPEGGLNQTAQRTLAKLEDAIEQLRDMMTRINRGEGSVGMLLNDPAYADEIKKAMKNVNKLLNKVGEFQFIVDLFIQQLNAYSGTRGGATLAIWPSSSHYYLLGVASDPRGNSVVTHTTTTAGGTSTTTTTVQTTDNALMLTGMIGKTFLNNRIDFSGGFLFGNGAGSIQFNLGPSERVDLFSIRNDVYGLQNNGGIADRLSGTVHPLPYFNTVYLTAGMEDFRSVDGHANFYYGAGIRFSDEDIKILFTLR